MMPFNITLQSCGTPAISAEIAADYIYGTRSFFHLESLDLNLIDYGTKFAKVTTIHRRRQLLRPVLH